MALISLNHLAPQLGPAAAAAAATRPAVHVLGVDGYHFSSAKLAAAGLASVKGTPRTIDAAGLLADIASLRVPPAGTEPVRLPAYDRQLHEPVPEAGPAVAAGARSASPPARVKSLSRVATLRSVAIPIAPC